MPTVIPVKFRYASRELWFDPRDTGAIEADHVICRTDRGLEIGLATGDATEVSRRQLHAVCGDAPLKPVERIATEADLERAEMLADRGDAALPTFRHLVDASGLDIKPVGVEWLFEGDKVICYFSAEERVDFRQLVRDLGRELHERIDMRQIGVREEASIIGGFAHCGQELCCARFGRQFEPVSIRMAKEQDLPLNSTKISGVCGRLMCCLRYEFEAYRDFKSRAPKRNALIETPLGKAKIVEYDTPKEQVCLRLENGKQLRVPLGDMEASDAARERAESLGCACRPDTVSRQALERLQSPEVQMALAELDRAMGIVPVDEIEPDGDIETKERSRRRRRTRGNDTVGSPKTPRTDDEVPIQSRRRRRRGGATVPGETGTDDGGSRGEREASSRGAANDQHAPGVRRRRHHSASASAPETDASVQQQGERTTKRPKRRPGDKGGAALRSGESARGQKTTKTDRDVGNGQAADGASRRPRRRRRRRSSGRSGDGGDAGSE